jgi:hypothetical protein
MLMVIIIFLGAFLVIGMDFAQSKYFFKCKEEGKAAQAGLRWTVFLDRSVR